MALDSSVRKFTLISGILSTVLYAAVASLLFNAPEIDEDPAAIVEWATANQWRIYIGLYLWGLCICATFAFLTGLIFSLPSPS
jgi:hypothetical protein